MTWFQREELKPQVLTTETPAPFVTSQCVDLQNCVGTHYMTTRVLCNKIKVTMELLAMGSLHSGLVVQAPRCLLHLRDHPGQTNTALITRFRQLVPSYISLYLLTESPLGPEGPSGPGGPCEGTSLVVRYKPENRSIWKVLWYLRTANTRQSNDPIRTRIPLRRQTHVRDSVCCMFLMNLCWKSALSPSVQLVLWSRHPLDGPYREEKWLQS